MEAKLNNCRAVKGDGFDETPEALYLQAQIQNQKSQMLLNALSYMVNNQVLGQETPTLIAEI